MRSPEREAVAEYARSCGRSIYFARRRKDMLQEELAERLGVTQGTVARWESGEVLPRDYWRGRIAFELDKDTHDLFPPVGRIQRPVGAVEPS